MTAFSKVTYNQATDPLLKSVFESTCVVIQLVVVWWLLFSSSGSLVDVWPTLAEGPGD